MKGFGTHLQFISCLMQSFVQFQTAEDWRLGTENIPDASDEEIVSYETETQGRFLRKPASCNQMEI